MKELKTFEELRAAYKQQIITKDLLYHFFFPYVDIANIPKNCILNEDVVDNLVTHSNANEDTLMSIFGGNVYIAESEGDVIELIKATSDPAGTIMFDDIQTFGSYPKRHMYIFLANNNAGGPSYLVPETLWNDKITKAYWSAQ